MTTGQALQSILGSLAVILALIVQTWLSKRFGEKQATMIGSKLDAVHEVVNGTNETAVKRVEQLTAALTEHGAIVPPTSPPPSPPHPEAA